MNGENIESSIKEMFNVYEFSKRSDGFKRFITFLLTVSTQVKTNKLTDALYIHDEPEISLHPSGARYLLDELIKISATNYVIFSTHSIFMIDREKTERHYIVNKKDEVTTIDQVNESNITDEEVIYNALGYSVFENLKLRNIIFEGWKDKKLFEIAIGKIPSALNNLKILTEIGLCHAKGVKDITRVVNILQLASRRWVVFTDGDDPAKERQRDYNTNYPGDDTWYRCDELLPDEIAVTGEDFIRAEVFEKHLKNVCVQYPILLSFKLPDLTTSSKLQAISRWLSQGKFNKEDQKPILNSIKDSLFNDLKPGHIEEKYYRLLVALASKLA